MDKKFWSFARRCFLHVLNRSPRPVLGGKSSYFKWFNREPKTQYFLPFGETVIYKNLNPDKKKLDSNNFKGIFVGY